MKLDNLYDQFIERADMARKMFDYLIMDHPCVTENADLANRALSIKGELFNLKKTAQGITASQQTETNFEPDAIIQAQHIKRLLQASLVYTKQLLSFREIDNNISYLRKIEVAEILLTEVWDDMNKK